MEFVGSQSQCVLFVNTLKREKSLGISKVPAEEFIDSTEMEMEINRGFRRVNMWFIMGLFLFS